MNGHHVHFQHQNGTIFKVSGLSNLAWICFLVAVLPTVCLADGDSDHKFVPEIEPQGFVKNRLLSLFAQPEHLAILKTNHELTPLGRYLLDLASSDANMAAHFHHLFSSESGNWITENSPLYVGTVPVNQGHRLPRLLKPFIELAQSTHEIPVAEKGQLMDANWVSHVEAMFRGMINKDGLLAQGTNVATMALSFHLLRTGFEAMKLRPEHIYTLPKAQALVKTILTTPYMLNTEDRWLSASPDFIAKCNEINRRSNYPADAIEISNSWVFYQGGLFIGWKTTLPSLHASWDALVILNTMFSYYPEPDPANPHSIFYLWNKEPEAQKMVAKKTIKLLQHRLWLDYQEQRGDSYCFIINGQVAQWRSFAAEVKHDGPQILDHAGYSRKSFENWLAACWAEMFGNPQRNTSNGVRALLAIADGHILQSIQQPLGKQKRNEVQTNNDDDLELGQPDEE
jgi:hypothetical protein